MNQHDYIHPPALGLAIASPGGSIGWWARRLAPRLATAVYLRFIRLTRARATRERIAHFRTQSAVPLFSHVEIETINKCNGLCAFCPVNRQADPRPPLRMTDTLFGRIVDGLAELGYSGYLSLYSNNEPLLDPNLAARASIARAALPDAYISLSTNGSLLYVNKAEQLLPFSDRIIVNNYGTSPALDERLRTIFDHFSQPAAAEMLAGKTLQFCLRRRDDVLTSRAGTAPNRPAPSRTLALPCSLPFSQLIIRPDGKVSLCCNDALGQATLGDAASQSLRDIWQGGPYTAVRTAMLERGRAGHPLCQRCDFVKHDVN